MNQQEVMQKIRELAAQIQQSSHPANTLDIAALKARCVTLYEHIQILVPVAVEMEVSKQVEEIKPFIEEQRNIHEVIKEESPSPETLSIEYEPVELFETEVIVKDEVTVTMKAETPVQETFVPPAETTPLKELFSKENRSSKDELSLHEHISQSTPKNDLKEKLHSRIDNLKSAISLNKKIAYVNMLFKENTVEYAKAIDKLNAGSNLDESMRYFNELKHHYGWENDNDLVRELQGLLEKRFA